MEFGDYRIEVVPDTQFHLDGGAMFGVVPRNLWSKVCPPDELNRIRMNMNCLFVEAGEERILIDTGIGEKWSSKETEIYGIRRERPLAESVFQIAGVAAEDITIIVNTHLHFDHAGGNTKLNEHGSVVATFPNARYFVSRGEYEHAEAPHERDRASYLPANWRPLEESGQLELKEACYEVVPGLRMDTVPGHSRTMQCMSLKRSGRKCFCFSDLVPMRAHLSLAWIMGYDLYPVETLESKKRLLAQSAREGWLCLFYHEPDSPLCYVKEEGGRYLAVAPFDAQEKTCL